MSIVDRRIYNNKRYPLVNVPDVTSEDDMKCTYEKDTGTFHIHSTNPDGSFKYTIDRLAATTNECLADEFTEVMKKLRMRGFEQGRKFCRDAFGG